MLFDARTNRATPLLVAALGLAVAPSCFYPFDRFVDGVREGDVTGVVVGRKPGHEGVEPLAGVAVALRGSGVRRSTASNGRFALRNLPAGSHRVTFNWDADGDGLPELGLRKEIPIQLATGPVRDAKQRAALDMGEVRLLEPGTVRGSVDGPYAPGSLVVVLVDSPAVVTVAADGSFETPRLAPGPWTVVAGARHRDDPSQLMLSGPVEVEVGENQAVEVRISLEEVQGKGRAQGTVLEPLPQSSGSGGILRGLGTGVSFHFWSHVAGFPSVELTGGFEFDFQLDVGLYLVTVTVQGADYVTVRTFGFRVGPGDDVRASFLLNLPVPEEEGPCRGRFDLDGDGYCFVDPREAGSCVATCRELGRDINLPCDLDGVPVDCDDDGDGQLDAVEGLGRDGLEPCDCGPTGRLTSGRTCENDPARSDRDLDGVCDGWDRFPDCVHNREPCQGSLCGNNATEPGEECDDANTVDDDGCMRSCRLPPTIVVTVPGIPRAGQTQAVEVRVTTSEGGFTGTVFLESSDETAEPKAGSYLFVGTDNEVGLIPMGFRELGDVTLTAWVDGLPTSSRQVVLATVEAGPAVSLEITGAPAPSWKAGTPANLVVTARDSLGNLADSYVGSLALTSSDPQVQGWTSPAQASSGRVARNGVELRTAGPQTLTATDTTSGQPVATTTHQVLHGDAARVTVSVTGPVVAGEPFTATVTVWDVYGNKVTDYREVVTVVAGGEELGTCASTDWDDGVCRVIVSIASANPAEVSVNAPGDLETTNAPVTVEPGLVHTVELVLPSSSAETGSEFHAHVNLRDAPGNLAVNFAGSVTLLWGSVELAVWSRAGDLTFPLELSAQAPLQVGTASLQAVASGGDLLEPVTSTPVDLSVNPGPVHRFLVTADPATAIAGVTFSLEVRPVDRHDNPVLSYDGVLVVSTTATVSHLPEPTTVTLTAGQHATLEVTLDTAGTWPVTVTDADKTGTVDVEVAPNRPAQLTLADLPLPARTDTPVKIQAEVRDAYRNLATAAGVQVGLSPWGGNAAVLLGGEPAVALDGVATFPAVRFRVPGTYQLEAHSGGLDSVTTAEFTVLWAAPSLQLGTPVTGGTCVDIPYTVAVAGARPVDLGVEYSMDQGGTWHRARQAGDVTTSYGVQGVSTGETPVLRSFRWNTTRDLPGVAGTARVRVQASHRGQTSPPMETDVILSDTLSFQVAGTASLSSGGTAQRAIPADLDNDGDTDLVVWDDAGRLVPLLRGADDLFTEQPAETTGVVAGAEALDVDGDGLVDLLGWVPQGELTHLALWLQGQDGTFRGTVSVEGLGPGIVPVLANVAQDGRKDVVVGFSDFGSVTTFSVAEGRMGLAGFPLLTDMLSTGVVAAARLQPGRMDAILVAENGGLDVHVMHPSPNGMAMGFLFSTALPVAALAGGDLDGDGRMDVVVATDKGAGGSVFELWLDRGQEQWETLTSALVLPPPGEIVVRDVDQDGRMDAVFAPLGHNQVFGLHVAGGSLLPTLLFTASGVVTSIRFADMDRDGAEELVVGTEDPAACVQVVKAMRPAPCDPVFQGAPRYHDTLGEPRLVAVLDFNVDGKPDVAAVVEVGGDIVFTQVLLFAGTGNGEVVPADSLPVGRDGLGCLVAGDVDGDDRPDLVMCERSGITVLLNREEGWLPVRGSTEPTTADRVVLADMDGDLDLDVVYLSSMGEDRYLGLLLYENETLSWATTYHQGMDLGYSLVVADLDGDGDNDVAAVTDNSITITHNDGQGFRASVSTLDIGASTIALAAGDFNGDGWTDLVGSDGFSVAWLAAQDDGGFTLDPILLGMVASFLLVEDVDGDGAQDLVIQAGSDGSYSVLVAKRLADGSFGLPDTDFPGMRIPWAYGMAVADMDGDGLLDMVLAGERSESSITIYPATSRLLGGEQDDLGYSLSQAVSGDFNGDGLGDVAFIRSDWGMVERIIMLTREDGTLDEFSNQIGSATLVYGLNVLDSDGDGRDDLLVRSSDGNRLSAQWLVDDFRLVDYVGWSGFYADAAAGDLDGDGFSDVVLVGESVDLAMASPGSYTTRSLSADSGPHVAVNVVDINHDGLLDILTAGDAGLVAFINGSDGVHGEFYPLEVLGGGVTAMQVVDVDGDGRLDVVFQDAGMRYLHLLRGTDVGLEATSTELRIAASGFRLAHLDGDGKVDLVTTAPDQPVVVTWLGDGQGSFQQWKHHGLPWSGGRVDVVRANRDHRPDIHVFSANGDGGLRITQR
jgi:cysteine-rich repeat protein